MNNQVQHYDPRLETHFADDNLVSMMRSLKGRDWGAGALLNAHDAPVQPPWAKADPDFYQNPIISVARGHSD